MPSNDPETLEEIQSNRWEIKERPFSSSIPIFGPIIVGFRNAWNSVAAKWYVRPIVEQQNQYNRLFAELIDHFNTQLVEDAREASEISHDIAEVTAMLTSMNNSLHSLEERLSHLEKTLDLNGE
jgi:hypothetical protein